MSLDTYWLFGALGGDIIGSVYEFDNYLGTDFPLFNEESFFTDDSAMTIATADAILSKSSSSPNYQTSYRQWGQDYPDLDYGGWFRFWLMSYDPEPYNSCGNGSAMRVSPVGFAFDTWEEVMSEAEASAACTHNHPEGIKGAQATAGAIFLARTGHSKTQIKDKIEDAFGYDLSQSLDEIRPTYTEEEEIWLCQGTVPQAICAFLESDSYEDTIRGGVSLGGDSDTLAAIAGSVAIAFYKTMSSDTHENIKARIDEPMLDVCKRFQESCGRNSG